MPTEKEYSEIKSFVEDELREWYKSGSQKTYPSHAIKLLDLGMPIDEVKDCLENLVSAIADEYGD
jgi:hypothetical protein